MSFRVSRDDDGNIIPVEAETIRFEMPVTLKPLTVGDTYQLEGWGDASQSDWPIEDKVYMFQNNVLEVEGEDVDLPDDEDEALLEISEDFLPYHVDDIIITLIMESGLGEMFEDEGKKEAVAQMM